MKPLIPIGYRGRVLEDGFRSAAKGVGSTVRPCNRLTVSVLAPCFLAQFVKCFEKV